MKQEEIRIRIMLATTQNKVTNMNHESPISAITTVFPSTSSNSTNSIPQLKRKLIKINKCSLKNKNNLA